MQNHDGATRGFSHLSRAWYGKDCLQGAQYTDQITIGFYFPQGGTSGEFCISWYQLCGKTTPKLECFDDAWHALNECSDLIKALADWDGMDIPPAKVCEILLSLGFVDMTKEKQGEQ